MQKTRLDVFLASQHPHFSRSQIKKLIEGGFVRIDGLERKPHFLLHGGEKIEMIRRAPEIPRAEPESIPLDILYEDEDLLAINKEAGRVVHPAPGNVRGTLVNAILYHLGLGGRVAPPDLLRPGIVHRLDKGTSGVLIVAKNERAQRQLSDQFKRREVEKVYLALVFGPFVDKSGTIARPIGRDMRHRRRFSSHTRRAREAVTSFEVKEGHGPITFVELRPQTGRTHQIRVHLSEAHHPIVGDTLYGAKSYLSSVKDERLQGVLMALDRPLLHAWRLAVSHPRTGKRVEFTAPLPEDFQTILRSLRD